MSAMRVLVVLIVTAVSAGCGRKTVIAEPAEYAETTHVMSEAVLEDHAATPVPPAAVPPSPVLSAATAPLSTFSIDVDTASYARSREALREGRVPAPWSVRTEEFVNYFDHDYPRPGQRALPFSLTLEAAPAPWAPQRHLLLVGLRGYDVPAAQLPDANLVFLVDVSGSMDTPTRLPRLKRALDKLVDQLRPQDRVAIVTYAGSAGVVLESTPGDRKQDIRDALQALGAGGSTAGAAGIARAYEIARANFIVGGINRVILASDGDFNVGPSTPDELEALIAEQRATGIALTVLGFGTPDYGEAISERLADKGNGNYAYIDDDLEAERVLRRELSASLLTIAADVKVQVEFNPARVADYRLVGYENRALANRDFADDEVDAGEIGAGHDVTALYDIALAGSGGERLPAAAAAATSSLGPNEIVRVRLRYKLPGEEVSRLIERSLVQSELRADPSPRLAFAAAVAAYADRLRGVEDVQNFGWYDILALGRRAQQPDPHGERAEFLDLVELTDALAKERSGQ